MGYLVFVVIKDTGYQFWKYWLMISDIQVFDFRNISGLSLGLLVNDFIVSAIRIWGYGLSNSGIPVINYRNTSCRFLIGQQSYIFKNLGMIDGDFKILIIWRV